MNFSDALPDLICLLPFFFFLLCVVTSPQQSKLLELNKDEHNSVITELKRMLDAKDDVANTRHTEHEKIRLELENRVRQVPRARAGEEGGGGGGGGEKKKEKKKIFFF